MVEVVLRKPFSLINSEFNDFLFAPIGDEGNGMTLSVISALTRLDIDPWQEAARLADLSKENAIQALAPIMARFPGGQWALADAHDIAARLAALLPQRVVPARSGATAAGGAGRPSARAIFVVIWVICSAAGWFAMGMHQRPPSSHDSAPTQTSEPHSPRP
jgi:hypothetical protein